MKIRKTQRARAEKPRFALIGAAMIILTLAGLSFFLNTEWHNYFSGRANEDTMLAQSLQSLIHPEHVTTLLGAGTPADKERHYTLTKESLMRLTSSKNFIDYAFVAGYIDGQIVILADSLDPADPGMIPLGTVYPEATDEFRTVLTQNADVFLPHFTDARGTWVCALVPLSDPASGEPIAIFGIYTDARTWYDNLLWSLHPDFIISFCILIISIALVALYISHARLRFTSMRTVESEALVRNVFDQAPIGIAISPDSPIPTDPIRWLRANRCFTNILGRNFDELSHFTWSSLQLPEESQAAYRSFVSGETSKFTSIKEYTRPDGSHLWLNMTLSRLQEPALEGAFLCLIEDITRQYAAETALREAERSRAVLLSHLPGMAYRCRFDANWTMEFVSDGCVDLTGYQPEELIENRVISYNSIIASEYHQEIETKCKLAASQNVSFQFEYEVIKKTGERRWVYEIGQAVRDASDAIVALEGIVIDINDRKMREQEIVYLSEHDHMTQLYDRRYLLEAAARLDAEGILPVSVAVCDINGVRVVNLAFGNEEGDHLIADVGKIVSSCARKGDIAGRTGGDEFTLLLPGAQREEARLIVRRIEAAVDAFNQTGGRDRYDVSLSIGCDTKTSTDTSIEQMMKTANENLLHAKLLNQKSSHSALVSSIMAALYARNQETEAHGQRLARDARMVGTALSLTASELDDLQLFSMLHDIGKIGIDDRILTKPAALSPQEREQMKKHSEIGHRIALSSPELAHIADQILHHHERWDGEGYPEGLKGEAIPLAARILAVCDAYDAMTKDRVYRQAIPQEDALHEIARCAGTQFDPKIAHIFIALVKAKGGTESV